MLHKDTKGNKRAISCSLQPNIKRKMQYKPMLCQTGEKNVLTKPNYIFEPKIDGTRVLIHKEGSRIRLINRKGQDISYRYPELKDISENIKTDSCVLDAELAVLNEKGMPDFLKLQQREQLDKKIIIESRAKEIPSTLFVFDILEIDCIEMTEVPLERRKVKLKEIIKESPLINLIPFSESGNALWKRIIDLGLEGVIAKDIRSRYEQKRSLAWLKIKDFNTIDALVIGYLKSKAKVKSRTKVKSKAKTRAFASLVLGCYDEKRKLRYIGIVGTGFSSSSMKELAAKMSTLLSATSLSPDELEKALIKMHSGKGEINSRDVKWIKPELIAEVRYSEFTENKELRAPSFLRLRFDKNPEECILE